MLQNIRKQTFKSYKELRPLYEKYYHQELNEEFIHNPKLTNYIKSFGQFPVNSYARIADNAPKSFNFRKFFSEKNFFQFVARDHINEWRPLILKFLDFPQQGNLQTDLYPICEPNLMKKIITFKIHNSDLQIQSIGHMGIEKIELELFRNIQGVSITRSENKHSSRYIKSEKGEKINYELVKDSKKGTFNVLEEQDYRSNRTDKQIKEDDARLEKSNIQQFIVSVITDRKINVYDKRSNQLVYGTNDTDMKLESNKKQFSQNQFYITDVNYLLLGNPHVQQL